MERRQISRRAGPKRDSPATMLLCSDRHRLPRLNQTLQPLFDVHTAASRDAMISILPTEHPTLAAVDVAFLRMHGLRCLSIFERSNSVQGVLVFGVKVSDSDLIPYLYRFPVDEIIQGYQFDHIIDGALRACRTHSLCARSQFGGLYTA